MMHGTEGADERLLGRSWWYQHSASDLLHDEVLLSLSAWANVMSIGSFHANLNIMCIHSFYICQSKLKKKVTFQWLLSMSLDWINYFWFDVTDTTRGLSILECEHTTQPDIVITYDKAKRCIKGTYRTKWESKRWCIVPTSMRWTSNHLQSLHRA